MNCEYLNSLIESIIQEELLDEGAQTVDTLEHGGYALAIIKGNRQNEFILYDPLLIEFRKNKNPVVGSITINQIKHNNDVWKASYSSARKSYGPILYEIAMSYIYPSFLRADTLFVSDGARKVWEYFYEHRRDEVNIEPLSKLTPDYPPADIDPSSNKNPEHMSMGYAFSIKQPKDYSSLLKRHQDFAKKINMDQKHLESSLASEANSLFKELF